MGVLAVSVFVLAALAAIVDVQAAGDCPIVNDVYSCNPKCVQNYDCSNGRVCCPNQCHLKSCVEPAKYTAGGSSGNKGKAGAGIYCNNVKCNAYEVCKLDKNSNRMKCMRA